MRCWSWNRCGQINIAHACVLRDPSSNHNIFILGCLAWIEPLQKTAHNECENNESVGSLIEKSAEIQKTRKCREAHEMEWSHFQTEFQMLEYQVPGYILQSLN